MYCHGDNLDGKGHFAHGFNPPPANFVDPGTIAMLQEAYLFWRIAKGGPGLPKESTPWNSVMPAWEDRLTEEQIWQVICISTTRPASSRALGAHSRLAPARRRSEPGRAPRRRRRAALGPRPAEAQAADAARGKPLYEQKCALCHGDKGDGKGPAAELLLPRPRDFTAGTVQDPHDGEQAVPTDQDLFRIITDGMPGTSMPAWAVLPDEGPVEPGRVPQDASPRPSRRRRRERSSCRRRSARPRRRSSAARRCSRRSSATSATARRAAATAVAAPSSRTTGGTRSRRPTSPSAWTFRGGARAARTIATRLANGVLGTPMPTFVGTVDDYKAFRSRSPRRRRTRRSRRLEGRQPLAPHQLHPLARPRPAELRDPAHHRP